MSDAPPDTLVAKLRELVEGEAALGEEPEIPVHEDVAALLPKKITQAFPDDEDEEEKPPAKLYDPARKRRFRMQYDEKTRMELEAMDEELRHSPNFDALTLSDAQKLIQGIRERRLKKNEEDRERVSLAQIKKER